MFGAILECTGGSAATLQLVNGWQKFMSPVHIKDFYFFVLSLLGLNVPNSKLETQLIHHLKNLPLMHGL